MTWTNKPSWQAGVYPNGSELEAVTDQIADLTAAGWTDYSTAMTITGATTSPTLGNSTLQAFYRQPPGPDMVDFVFKLTIGSTFTAGSGIYTFSMPVPMISPQIFCGTATFFDGGTAFRTANLIAVSATGLLTYQDGSGAALGSGGPGTAWATGDYVAGQISYGV